uniref:Cytochrome P450 CYP76AD8 n=1 Tax=Opuntia ficus-indica TaxID=371859 RepID=A0A0U1YJ93_9CARY|nr:cytochrome P450 CYP76AD8 [Opuntia ficus-indica]
MDTPTLSYFISAITFYYIAFQIVKLGFNVIMTSKKTKRRRLPLPPGPKPLPIIGNVFELGPKPHRSFASLAKVYGPLMSLRLGSVTTIIVSSSDVAKEMFLKNDQPLSSTRTIPNSVTAGDHHKLTMSWLPVSPKWRSFRKITTFHLLSPQRLDACSGLRQAKVQQLYEYVLECSRTGQAVDIGKAAFTTSLNLLSKLFFSLELANHTSDKSQEFKELIWNIMEDIGKPNYADYFPCLKYFDPSGIRRRLACSFEKLIEVFQVIIRQRLSLSSSGTNDHNNDVLDVLLDLYQQKELSMEEINHLLVDIFDAGTDTTSSTFEWAMAELIKNPRMMETAQAEIKLILGKDLHIQESDIPKLPYLRAIIKETLRLHPPTVFLLPRKADADVELYGYTVPKNAQILVNLWALGRDPKVWENPDVFSPERFLGCDIDVKGRNFGLLPFGAGRRICPGMNLAYRMLTLMLATLLQSFDWKLPNEMNPQNLDMDEKFGIALQKTKPLQIIPLSKD